MDDRDLDREGTKPIEQLDRAKESLETALNPETGARGFDFGVPPADYFGVPEKP
ncbi:MAG: hypothetical protein Q8R08_00650 [bacterium]|nr:hypothetical protein [bacterium]